LQRIIDLLSPCHMIEAASHQLFTARGLLRDGRWAASAATAGTEVDEPRMDRPGTSFRLHPMQAPRLTFWLCTVALGLAALTGCGWAVLAGHAWLSLLHKGSRWIAEIATDHAEPPPPQDTADTALIVLPVAPAASIASSGGAPRNSAAGGPPPSVSQPNDRQQALEYEGAACAEVFVYAVTISESSPRWSAVSLATSGTGRGKYAHPGQKVEEWEVLGITDDWTGANPVVWLARENEVCRAGLTGNPARVEAAEREALQREATLQEEARRRRAARRRRRARLRQR
jgi:hypothetical protein